MRLRKYRFTSELHFVYFFRNKTPLPNKIMYFCILNDESIDMNRIKELLEVKGISQTDLAHRLGKSFNMVNLYATNKVQPPIPVLYEIADILRVDVRELLQPNKNR